MPSASGVVTGGAAIVDALIANGVDTVFGLPGAQLYPLFDGLAQRASAIRTVGARHEQTCGYMAFGYARSTGRPGVFAVVPGPGVLNTTAALSTASGCNVPVLCITGQVPTAFLGKGRGHLHELPDQLATLHSLVKWAARIERVEDAPAVMNEAFRQMTSGRPGPVAVEMAWDVMASSASVLPLPAAVAEPAPSPHPAVIEQAAKILAEARAPMIMTGGGAQGAAAAVRALAEELDAPVAAFRGGRGVMAEDHPLAVSSYAAHKLWPETDVLLGIGSRLEMPFMRWNGMMTLVDRPPAPPTLIRIDIDPGEFDRLVPHVPILGDAADATTALLAAVLCLKGRDARPLPLKGGGLGWGSETQILDASRPSATLPLQGRGENEQRSSDSRTRRTREAIARAKEDAAAETAVVQPQMAYLDVIRDALPRDGFFVPELSQVGFASYFGFPVYEPRTYVSEGFQGTLGFGFPTALGVKVAHPDKAVVSVTGDGGFLFAAGELATAVQERIGLVTILFNNSAYGNVMRDQQTGFGGRRIGSELQNPDFLQLAAAFGVAAHRVSSPEELRPVLRAALAADIPTLIEVSVPRGSEVSPWPFIHPKA